MRVKYALVAGVGQAIIPLDPAKPLFNNAYAMWCDQAGSGAITGQIDATFSDLSNNIPVTYSQSTTAITLTFPAANPHTLGSNVDYMLISNTGIVGVDGFWAVSSVTNDTVVVVTSTTSQTKSGNAIATPVRRCANPYASAGLNLFPSVPNSTLALPVYYLPYSALILRVTVNAGSGIAILGERQAGSGPL